MSALNPFPRPLPVMVMLRNKDLATIEQLVDDRAPFTLLGGMGIRQEPFCQVGPKCEHLGELQLWRTDGRWREDGQRSPLDIVGVAVARDDNAFAIEPFAPAAGPKGGQS